MFVLETSNDPSWTDVVEVALIAAQLIVIVVGSIFAWKQLSQAKQLREDQTRPFVTIDLDSSRPKFFDLVVKNSGLTMARNVEFEFSPSLRSSDVNVSLDKLKMLTDGISSLPPGKEIRTYFDSGPSRYQSELPDIYEILISYSGTPGERKYSETMELDFGLYWNRMSINVNGVHEIHRELERIRTEIHKWTAKPGPGIHRVTEDDRKARTDELKREFGSE